MQRHEAGISGEEWGWEVQLRNFCPPRSSRRKAEARAGSNLELLSPYRRRHSSDRQPTKKLLTGQCSSLGALHHPPFTAQAD